MPRSDTRGFCEECGEPTRLVATSRLGEDRRLCGEHFAEAALEVLEGVEDEREG